MKQKEQTISLRKLQNPAESRSFVRQKFCQTAENCRNVPENPPKSFCEAMHFVWFVQLGRPLPSREFQTPTEEQIEHWKEQARTMGIRVVSYR